MTKGDAFIDRPTFVIAGDYGEYFNFLQRKQIPRNTQEYIFISDPTRLFGVQNIKILCVGQYFLSPVYNYQNIEIEKKLRNITFVDETGHAV